MIADAQVPAVRYAATQNGHTVRMHLDTVRSDDRSTITVTGEMDVDSANALYDEALSEAADRDEVRVDLVGVTFIDSVGLSVLIRIQHEFVHDRLARLVLVNPSDRVHSLLDLTATLSHFEIEA